MDHICLISKLSGWQFLISIENDIFIHLIDES